MKKNRKPDLESRKELKKIVAFLKEIDKGVFKSRKYQKYLEEVDKLKPRENRMLTPEERLNKDKALDAIYTRASSVIIVSPQVKPNNELLKNLLEKAPIEFGDLLGNIIARKNNFPIEEATIKLICMALLNHNQGGIESLSLLSQAGMLMDHLCEKAITQNIICGGSLQYDFDRLIALVEFKPGFLNISFQSIEPKLISCHLLRRPIALNLEAFL